MRTDDSVSRRVLVRKTFHNNSLALPAWWSDNCEGWLGLCEKLFQADEITCDVKKLNYFIKSVPSEIMTIIWFADLGFIFSFIFKKANRFSKQWN